MLEGERELVIGAAKVCGWISQAWNSDLLELAAALHELAATDDRRRRLAHARGVAGR
jgi:hypothetical protein